MIPRNNGIIMVTFVPEHVASRRKEAKMEMVLDHLFYITGRVGRDHVGLGSNFDGIASAIPRLEDVTCYPRLLKAILDRGATGATGESSGTEHASRLERSRQSPR